MPGEHRRFVVGTDRDDRTHSIARLLRDDGNEVVLAQRDDTTIYAIDAVQEDADVLVTATGDHDQVEDYRELEDRLDEYGAGDVYVAVDDHDDVDGIEDHVDAVYRPDDSLIDIVEDLYRPFDWQYLDQVGERTYDALEDWKEPRQTDPGELETYLTEEMGSSGKAAATKILNSNPSLFEA